MRGTILQPTYLPWLGYFELISNSEIFVVFDHVQFEKKSWQHRNKIKSANGEVLLSIPVKKAPRNTPIHDIEISYNNQNPLLDHWKTIVHNYQKAPFFNQYKNILEKIYHEPHPKLSEFTTKLIMAICDILNIKTNVYYSSKLNLNEDELEKTQKVINLCKTIGITTLYDTHGAKDILNLQEFKKQNIKAQFQNYEHPVYSQLYGSFIPQLSVIDLLFNEGGGSLKIIKSSEKYEKI